MSNLPEAAGEMTTGDKHVPPLRLFVYGTLKRGYWNHDRYCSDALSIEEATVRGRLYELPSGIPVLEVPEEDVLAVGTSSPADYAVLQDSVDHAHPNVSRSGDWDAVCGELITFPCPNTALPWIDRLEGFTPDGPSLYRRVLVSISAKGRALPAWCYVCDPMSLDCMRRLGESWTPIGTL